MPTNPAAVTIQEPILSPGALVNPPIQRAIVKPAHAIGYNCHNWQRVRFGSNVAATSAFSALSVDNAYLWRATMPQLADVAEQVGIIEKLDPSYELALRFFGLGADAGTMTAKVWGLAPLQDGVNNELIGDPVCTLSLVLGGGTIAGSRALGNPNLTFRMVETITISEDFTIDPGILRVANDGAAGGTDGCEIIVIDRAPGYVGYVVEMLLGTATGWGALYKG